MSFSQLPAVKKPTENGAAGKIVGPSNFETALIEATKTLQALEFWASNDFSLKYALASKMQWAAKGQTKLK